MRSCNSFDTVALDEIVGACEPFFFAGPKRAGWAFLSAAFFEVSFLSAIFWEALRISLTFETPSGIRDERVCSQLIEQTLFCQFTRHQLPERHAADKQTPRTLQA